MGYKYGKYSSNLYSAELLKIGKDGATWYEGNPENVEYPKSGDFCFYAKRCEIYKRISDDWVLVCTLADADKIDKLLKAADLNKLITSDDLPFVNVKCFWEKEDGDDYSPAFERFIEHITENNLQGYIPEGTYNLSKSISYVFNEDADSSRKPVRIVGAGIDKTELIGNGTDPVITISGSDCIILSDFTVNGNSPTAINGKDEYYITDRASGIQIMQSSNVFVERIKTVNCSSYGMYAIGEANYKTNADGTFYINPETGKKELETKGLITEENIHFSNCHAEYCWCGFQIQGARNSSISNCSAKNITRTGVNFKVPVDNCTMSDITTENCGLCGVNVGSSYLDSRATNCVFNNLICKEVICGMLLSACENCIVDNILVKVKDMPGYEGTPVIDDAIVPSVDEAGEVTGEDKYTLGYGDMYIREKDAGWRNGIFMNKSKNNYVTNAKIHNIGSGCACVRLVSTRDNTNHNYVKMLDATTQVGGKIVISSASNGFVTENNIIEVPAWFDVGIKIDDSGKEVPGTNFPFPEPSSPNHIKVYGGSGGVQYVMESPTANEEYGDDVAQSDKRYTLNAYNTANEYIEIVSNKIAYIIDTITGGYIGRRLTLHTTSATNNAILTSGGNIAVDEDVTVALSKPVTLIYTTKNIWTPII